MKRIAIVVIFSLFYILAFGQKSEKNDVSKLNRDLQYLQKVLYTSHPSTFRYTTQKTLDSLFLAIQFSENDTTASTIELERRVRLVLSKIGCIHTSISKSVTKYSKDKIPYELFTKGENIWITSDIKDSLSAYIGDKLLSINGHTASEMIQKMNTYHAGDGYTQTFSYQLMNERNWFSKLYEYYYDSDSIKTYAILSGDLDTVIIQRKSILAKTGKKKKNKKSTSKSSKKVPPKHITKYDKRISVERDSANNIAILKISSFSGVPFIGKPRNALLYKKAIKDIQKEGYGNLVIDLRDNLGGIGAAGAKLSSYFATEKHRYPISLHRGRIIRYATLTNKIGAIANFFIGNIIASRTPIYNPWKSNITIRPLKKPYYQGKTYVIINGFTGSTASNVASFFKHKNKATILGEESGGGDTSVNAYYMPKVKLPYSKIVLKVPQHYINLNFIEDTGSGVKPDIKIEYTINDVLEEKDLEMEAIKKDIKERMSKSN